MIDKHFDELSCQANNAQERQWKVFEVAIDRIESLKLRVEAAKKMAEVRLKSTMMSDAVGIVGRLSRRRLRVIEEQAKQVEIDSTIEAGPVSKQEHDDGYQPTTVRIELDGKILTSKTLESLENEMKKLMERIQVIDNRVDATKSRLWIVSADDKQLSLATGSRMRGIQTERLQEVEVTKITNQINLIEIIE
jgi:hypothetical protein